MCCVVLECEDRVSWHRDQSLCFQPADPSVEKVSSERNNLLQWSTLKNGVGLALTLGKGGHKNGHTDGYR